MGDYKTTFWQEITNGLAKFFIYTAYILLGVVAKIAFDSRSMKLTKRQIGIKVALSVFAGALASIVCKKAGWEYWSAVVVPVATLIGEGLVGYVMSNWRKFADKYLGSWAKENGKKDEN